MHLAAVNALDWHGFLRKQGDLLFLLFLLGRDPWVVTWHRTLMDAIETFTARVLRAGNDIWRRSARIA